MILYFYCHIVAFLLNLSFPLSILISTYPGILRTIGDASGRMDAKNIEISRRPMEWIGVASRGVYQQAKWCFPIKVRCFFHISYINFERFVYSFCRFSLCFYRVERSSDQVIKPVNLEALSKWVGNIPEDVVRDMADIAPMLSILGYDPYANPPDYGKPDSWVQDNTFKVRLCALILLCINNSN